MKQKVLEKLCKNGRHFGKSRKDLKSIKIAWKIVSLKSFLDKTFEKKVNTKCLINEEKYINCRLLIQNPSLTQEKVRILEITSFNKIIKSEQFNIKRNYMKIFK